MKRASRARSPRHAGAPFCGALLSLCLVSCAKPLTELPTISIPIERKPAAGDVPPPKAPPPEPPPKQDDLPDPPPQRSTEQVDLVLRFEEGSLRLVESERVSLAQAESTPRRMGRFAAELWLGPELLERLRFEVPLLGADGGEEIESGLTTEVRIRLPLVPRANRLELVDRKSNERLTLPWPPEPAARDDSQPESTKGCQGDGCSGVDAP